MKSKKKSYILAAIITAVSLGIFVLALLGYTRSLDKTFYNFAKGSMVEVMDQQKFNIQTQMATDMNQLKNIAKTVATLEQTDQDIMVYLNEILPNTNFERFLIADLNGDAVFTNGATANIFEKEHFQAALVGETKVITPFISSVTSEVVVPIATPIYNQNSEIVAVLAGTYTCEKLQNILLPSFNGNGVAFVVDKKGNLITSTLPVDDPIFLMDDITRELDQASFYQGSRQQLLDDMAQNQSGSLFFNLQGKKHYGEYIPLGINDWYLILDTPFDAIFSSVDEIQHHTMRMGIIIIILLMLCCLIPLALLRRAHRKLSAEHEDMQKVIELGGKAVMRYYPKTDKAEIFGDFSTLYTKGETVSNISNHVQEDGVYDEKGLKISNELKEAMGRGESKGSYEINIKQKDNSIVWVKLQFISIFNDKGEVHHCLISLADVTAEHTEKEQLTKEATTDSLTGLLNRNAMFETIKNSISTAVPEQEMAMLLIDVDNFKKINDSQGHQFGDSILVSISEILKASFRCDDIIGRLGGDEFMVFIPQNASRDMVIARTKNILDKLKSLDTTCRAAVSIGIALSKGRANNLEELYRHADKAMYERKFNGKNGYAIYSSNGKDGAMK